MDAQQRIVRMRNGLDDRGACPGERVTDGLDPFRHLVAGDPHADPELAPGHVAALCVRPDDGDSKRHAATLIGSAVMGAPESRGPRLRELGLRIGGYDGGAA